MQEQEASFATPATLAAARKLGDAIRQARLARNRTREDFAERARISAPTLDRLERGDVAVRMGAWLSALETSNLLHLLDAVSRPESDTLGELERGRQIERGMRKRASGPKAAGRKGDDYDF